MPPKNYCTKNQHGEFNENLLTVEVVAREKGEGLAVTTCRKCGYLTIKMHGLTSGPYYDEKKDEHEIVINPGKVG